MINFDKVDMTILTPHIDQIKEACSINQVKRLFALGSVTRGQLNKASDIDMVVEFNVNDPISYADHYFNLKEKLQELLKRPVDLLEEKAIRNPLLRNEIDKTKVLISGD